MSAITKVKNIITGEEPRGYSSLVKSLPVETTPPKIDPNAQQALVAQYTNVSPEKDSRSPLGFNNAKQRGAIRGKAFSAAYTGYIHRGRMTYSEGGSRWSGIDGHHRAYRHEYPPVADCSAFVTWCLWDATRAEKTWDFVNGDNWQAGYTGTMTQHGADVHGGELLMADAVFYGGSWSVPAHVAIYIGHGRVISHGMQGDPRIYPVNLNGALPITRFKRYIR